MKLFRALMLISLLSAGQINSQSVGLGNTDPSVFTKYKLPATQFRKLELNGSTYVNKTRSSAQNQVNVLFYNLDLSPTYLYSNETDDRLYSLYTDLNASLAGDRNENVDSYTNKSKTYGFSFAVTPSLTEYFSSGSNLFFNVNGNILVSMNEMNGENETKTQPVQKSWRGGKMQIYTGEAGIGWGRQRDVTPVVNALRFQERLKVLNKINSDLSESDITAISQQFSRFYNYSQVYDRPLKYFYNDLSNILRERNISLDNLNLYSAAYLMETMQELKFQRREGFYTGLNLELRYQNNYSMEEIQPNPRQAHLYEMLFSTLNYFADYSHQLDLYSQFSGRLGISGGPNVLAKPEIRQHYYTNLDLKYSRELTDRFVINAENETGYNIQNGDEPIKELQNYFVLSLDYYIENNISLNSAYTWSFRETTFQGATSDISGTQDIKQTFSGHSFRIGIRYILQNSLNIF